jgi:predicted dehydrogenase
MSRNSRLGVTVVGCGKIGIRRAESAVRHPATRLFQLIDQDAALARDWAGKLGCGASSDWKRGVRHPGTDLVVVSTTNDALADIACEALAAGKHVLVEKPMGRNRKEAERIAAAALRSKKILKVGFNLRYHPALKEARKIAASGKIGKPLFVRGRYGHGGRTGYEKEWRCDPRRSGGGELTDQGVHLIDLSQWFLGVPRQAAAFLQTAFWPVRPLEDNGSVLLRYAEGRTSSFQVSWTQWKNLFHFELYGSKGFVEVSGLGGSYGPETLTWGLRKHPGKAPEIRKTVFKGPDSSWAEEWDDFVRAVQSGNTPPNGPKESLSVMRTLDALYRSHRAGKIVSI